VLIDLRYLKILKKVFNDGDVFFLKFESTTKVFYPEFPGQSLLSMYCPGKIEIFLGTLKREKLSRVITPFDVRQQ